MSRSPLATATVVALVVGLGAMLPFEGPLARIVGVSALFAFIVCGAFLIANPDDLGRPPDDEAPR